MTTDSRQFISYIAPGAPATRRPAEGDEPLLRPEIGFTPKWYRAAPAIDFGERYHRLVTVSNCTVNMISGDQYHKFLFPFDLRLAKDFGCIGIHYRAWNATSYLEHYAAVPKLAYIDTGIDSNLARARSLIPHARRALTVTSMDLVNKPLAALKSGFERIVAEYAPCDLVLADIEAGTSGSRVSAVMGFCDEISGRGFRGSNSPRESG